MPRNYANPKKHFKDKVDTATFQLFENVIQSDFMHIDESNSLFDVKDGVPFVKCLNKHLENISMNRRFELEETALNPDSPLLKAYTLTKGVLVSQ